MHPQLFDTQLFAYRVGVQCVFMVTIQQVTAISRSIMHTLIPFLNSYSVGDFELIMFIFVFPVILSRRTITFL